MVPIVSVPLNAMCSNMCASPVLPMGSCTEPASTMREEGEDRRLGPLADNNGQAVGSFLTVMRFSKDATSLRCGESSKKQHKSEGPEYAVFHWTSRG